jgi:serine/threonine-protein kinase RsbW
MRHGSAGVVRLTLPSDVGVIEETVALVERHCCQDTAESRRFRFRLQVAVSEALANAIIRGNCERADRQVVVEIARERDAVRITVTDEGPGFDPAALPDPCAPDCIELTRGRGVFLIRKLVDDLSFNPRGNSICMILRRPSGGSTSSSMA